jgi:Uma2 family endonuclease
VNLIRLKPFNSSMYLPTAEELPDSDDKPMEGGEFQSLITNMLWSSLSYAWKDRRDFFFGVNMGVYYHPQKPVLVPHCFLSLGVDRFSREYGRLSYVIWEEDYIVPFLAIEIVVRPYSNESEERRNIYAQIGVLYYAVFLTDPQSRLGHKTLEIYRLVDGEYELIPEEKVWMPEIGLALGKEKRLYGRRFREWLYWYDKAGQRLVVLGEPTDLDTLKARNDRLAQKLRELGFDPAELS